MIIKQAEMSTLRHVTTLALKLWPDNEAVTLEEEFEQLLQSSKDIVYLADVEGEAVGFIHMSLRFDYVEGCSSSPVGYVEGIYVEEQHRTKGISRALVRAGEEWSRSHGCREMASDTEIENHSSQQFHQKIGFKETGRIVVFIKEIE